MGRIGDQAGRHWAVRVVGAVSLGEPGVGELGVGATGSTLEIRNLDTGAIGTFRIASIDLGGGIGVGVSVGNGEWSYFETANSETLHSFEVAVRTPTIQVGTWSVSSLLVLPI